MSGDVLHKAVQTSHMRIFLTIITGIVTIGLMALLGAFGGCVLDLMQIGSGEPGKGSTVGYTRLCAMAGGIFGIMLAWWNVKVHRNSE